jgi:hypothetical protein
MTPPIDGRDLLIRLEASGLVSRSTIEKLRPSLPVDKCEAAKDLNCLRLLQEKYRPEFEEIADRIHQSQEATFEEMWDQPPDP